MKKIRYHLSCLAAFVAAIVLFSPEDSAPAEKRFLKSTSKIVKENSKRFSDIDIKAQSFIYVSEIEPNNETATAQVIDPPSPSSIEGQADTTDAGDIFISYDDGDDDFEDLFKVTLNSPGINITLTNFQSDLDIFIFDESLLIHDLSNESDVTTETIANDTLQAGSYFIGVSIYDIDPDGPGTSDYTLTVTGDLATPTSVDENFNDVIASQYFLSDNYPNPFNPTTQIKYNIPEAGWVQLKIYNALGQEIATLVDNLQPAGTYGAIWTGVDFKGSKVSSGLYFYKLKTDNFTQTRKMLLIK